MIDQAPDIPPAVIEFAKQNNCVKVIKNGFWNGDILYKKQYTVYNAKKDDPYYFYYILVSDKEIRFAEDKEINEVGKIYY